MLSRLTLAVGAAAIAAACATPSGAATRHYRHVRAYPHYAETLPEPSLTIRKRSFLDPGVVVPVGSEQAYVAQSTTIGAPYVVRDLLHNRIDAWRADKFSIPGGEPAVRFWTPGAPD
jgi:hypothetical protein